MAVNLQFARNPVYAQSDLDIYEFFKKLTALYTELAQVEIEIEKLLDALIGANAVLLSYACFE